MMRHRALLVPHRQCLGPTGGHGTVHHLIWDGITEVARILTNSVPKVLDYQRLFLRKRLLRKNLRGKNPYCSDHADIPIVLTSISNQFIILQRKTLLKIFRSGVR